MRNLQWWCVARGEMWSWEWRPIVGVWVFMIVFGAVYWHFLRRSTTPVRPRHAAVNAGTLSNAPGIDSSKGGAARAFAAGLGLLLLWLSLDWPVGQLGAGYLASVHTLQFLMLGMIIPGLLLYGANPDAVARIGRNRRAVTALQKVTHPVLTALFFTFVMVATHAAAVLDLLKRSTAGSFLLDMAWLSGGLALAWPMLVSVPARPRFTPPLQILYLFAGTIAHVFIGMWLLSARYPVYETYELASRVGGIDALTDQHLAGAAILMIGSPLIVLAIALVFFRWQGTGEEKSE